MAVDSPVQLKIGRVDRHAGCCTGREEVFLLCEKMNKDDISVRFYEEETDWEAYADFGPSDVHHECAIVFKTPAYKDVNIQRPVNVFIQLKCIRSDERSEPIPFTYSPQVRDIDEIERKREKPIFPESPFLYFDMSTDAAGLFGSAEIIAELCSSNESRMMIDVSDENQVTSSSSATDDMTEEEMVNRGTGDQLKMQGKGLTDTSTSGSTKAMLMNGCGIPLHTLNTMSEESIRRDVKYPVDMHRVKALQNYARTGKAMFILIQDRHLLSVCDKDGDTAVHLAIINKKTEALASIVDAQPFAGCLNQCNKLKQTPLHLVTLTNQPEMLDLLLPKADVNLVDRHGDTCFHIAARYGYEQCLHRLIFAADSKYIGEVLKVLNFKGISAVHEAVNSGHVNLLELLLTSGGDVNLSDGRSGRTPLHYATEIDNCSAVEILLRQDSLIIDAVTFNGETALHLAAGRGCLAIAAMLIAMGADPTEENNHSGGRTGQTPRDLASGNQQMLRILHGDTYSSVMNISQQQSVLVQC